ncbi:MAG: antitoxin YefM, partial [Mycobacterium sp.]|nr:antitoxin YefM [Mycobacterium sp.]
VAILGDQEMLREVRAAPAAAEAEDGEIYTLDEVTEEMRAAGRLPQ